MDFVRARLGRPTDDATFERIRSAGSSLHIDFIGEGESKKRILPSQLSPTVANQPMDFGSNREFQFVVNRAVLKMSVVSETVTSSPVVGWPRKPAGPPNSAYLLSMMLIEIPRFQLSTLMMVS